MIRNDLLEIIAELNFWHRDQETGIQRSELDEVMKLVDMKDIALLIFGVRRAGKTYLAKQILRKKIENMKKEQTLYVNFEDRKLEPYLNANILDDLYETYRYYINKKDFAYIVLDEVHNVKGWEKWVRIMLEKKENIKIIITGSGGRIITPELASVLTGRKITYSLFPLSFKDFLRFKNTRKKHQTRKEISALLHEYMEFGSFPMAVLADNKEQKNYFLQEIYDDIITRDIIFRYKLREEETIRKLAYLTLNSFSRYVSIRKLRNTMKSIMKTSMSPSTISNYIEYFEKSFLFMFTPIFSYKIKEQMQYPKKAYCVDTGLISAVVQKFSENTGLAIENIIAVELRRRLKRGSRIYYWKSSSGREVDFAVRNGLKTEQLIQACYDIENLKTKERELKALVKASKELKCNNLLIITGDYEDEEKYKGKKIKYIPLWKWLLNLNKMI